MRLAAFIFGMVFTLTGVTATAHATPLFDDGPGTTDFSVFPGWQRVMAQAKIDDAYTPVAYKVPAGTTGAALTPTAPLCHQDADCALSQWKAFIAATAKLPRAQQLDAVNRWVNSHPYVEDWANWGLPDYWESPREFLTRGGDCEDFAIIKYFTLVQLGFSPDDMRIMIVNDTNLEIFHAILAVRQTKGEPILLDNQAKDLVPMSAAPQYHLIYSLNERGWWMANSPTITISSRNITNEFQTASGSPD